MVESIIPVLNIITVCSLVHLSVWLIAQSATQVADSDVLLLEAVPQVHSCCSLITE